MTGSGPETAAPSRELIYVGDPMCSWCWGFAPVLDQLQERFELPVRTVVGGLRPGPDARPLDDGLRAFLREEWPKIQTATGQPFDLSFLDRESWLYDTEPAAIAVVSVRSIDPSRTLEFFATVQRAFYAEGQDITQLSVQAALVEQIGLDTAAFEELAASPAAKDRAWQDFSTARELGATAFPTLLVRSGDRLALVTQGYVPFATLEPPLAEWLDAA